jgi:hypothetical protein
VPASAGTAVSPEDGRVSTLPVPSLCPSVVDDGAAESDCVAPATVSVLPSAMSLESGAVLDDAVPDVFVSSLAAGAPLVEPVPAADESLSPVPCEDPVDELDPLFAELVVDPPLLLDAELVDPAEPDELDDDPESEVEPVVSAAATP